MGSSVFTVSTTQWIGATRKGIAIERGAALLADEFERLGVTSQVTLADPTPDETRVGNIVGRGSLLQNLTGMQRLLESTMTDRTLLLGGDCATDLGPIAHHARNAPDLTVVYFDAHADINQPSESPSGALHGMVLRHLLGDGDQELVALLDATLAPSQIRYRGVRECDPAESALIEQLEIICEPINATPPFGPIYIHLDLDVLDPTEFAHTMYPTAGGPSIAELNTALMSLFATGRVVGFGITECAAQTADQLTALGLLIETVAHWATSETR
jgi:arginase